MCFSSRPSVTFSFFVTHSCSVRFFSQTPLVCAVTFFFHLYGIMELIHSIFLIFAEVVKAVARRVLVRLVFINLSSLMK